MLVNLPGIDMNVSASMLWLDLFGGFDPLGLDGLVLLATLLIPILLYVSRRSALPDEPVVSASAGSVAIDDPNRYAGGAAAASPAPERPPLTLDGLLAWPDWVATRLHLRSAPVAAVALGIGLLLVWIGQRALLDVDPGVAAFTVWFVGILLVVLLYVQADQGMQVAYAAARSFARLSRARIAVLVGIGVASVYLWNETPKRAIDDSSLDLVAIWLASIAALVLVAAGPPRPDHTARLRAWLSRSRDEILITIGVALIALVPRIYDLSNYPWALSGDEGTFAITSRSFLQGEFTNPFAAGPWGYPSLLFILQGWLMDLTGESVGASRMLSAVLGTASVVAIYWLTRHHFGRWTGLAAAVIAATFNFHLFWSRDAQNAIAPMLFLPLALLLLDRGLIGRSRLDSLAAGLVIAFAQFFHPSNRILFPIVAVYAVYALLYERPDNRASLERTLRALVPNLLWVGAGALIGHLPLLAYFNVNRNQFSDRTNQVSVFASGWLDQEKVITGKGAVEILWIQFRNAAMLPFNTIPNGHYRPELPFGSWPMVIPLAIGMAIVTLTFWRRQSFGLALAFWATVAGIALTDGPPQTNRYTSSGPFLAIFAAIGIVGVACIAIRLIRLPRVPVAILATAATLLIAGWHLNWYFEEPNPVAVSSDGNTQIANRLAHEAASHGDGLTVYLSGQPRLTYWGFNNIPYIAPNATGTDVAEPWSASTPPPELTGPTLFAFVPERLGELEVVRSWFPDGTVTVSTMPNGEEILTTYFVDAPVVEAAVGRADVPGA